MTRITGRAIAAAVGLAIAAAGPARASAPAARTDELAKGNNRFALEMYGRLTTGKGNIFFSPFSIRSALAMTYAGAKDATALEMRKALRFTQADDVLHASFAATSRDLEAGAKAGYKLTVANSLWGQKGYKFLQPFLDIARAHYGGGLNEVDFAGATEKARGTINLWVAKKTNDKILDLIPPDGILPDTRLVLVNAIWFKGDWAEPFKKSETEDAPFMVNQSEKLVVPLMHRAAEYAYAAQDGIQILDLPYVGDNLSMVVLLPKAGDGLARLEPLLTPEKVTAWLASLDGPASREVTVFLPKFKMTWGTKPLKPVLTDMGMALPFQPGKADFSGMNGVRPPQDEALFISEVFHKAFVDVNEEGTEAAAATAVLIAPSCAPMEPAEPVVFRADHPFVFLIRDRVSGNILFIGRVVNPQG